MDELAQTYGIDADVFGGLVGFVVLMGTVIVLSVFRIEFGPVPILVLLAVCTMNVVLGFWPTWVIVILSVIGGLMAWREISHG